MTNFDVFGLCCFIVGLTAGLILALAAAYLWATASILREERLAHLERKCGLCR